MQELIEQLEIYKNQVQVKAETQEAGTMTEIGAKYFSEQEQQLREGPQKTSSRNVLDKKTTAKQAQSSRNVIQSSSSTSKPSDSRGSRIGGGGVIKRQTTRAAKLDIASPEEDMIVIATPIAQAQDLSLSSPLGSENITPNQIYIEQAEQPP